MISPPRCCLAASPSRHRRSRPRRHSGTHYELQIFTAHILFWFIPIVFAYCVTIVCSNVTMIVNTEFVLSTEKGTVRVFSY